MYGINEYVEEWEKANTFSWNSFWIMFGTFLDRFYAERNIEILIQEPAWGNIPKEIQSFIASSVDYLAHIIEQQTPKWAMKKEYELKEPLFPSNLKGDIKAVMLIESPIEYKVRNIYVLKNVLERC